MGTSSARRAPTTRLWRRAKGAATRYLAPGEGRAVEAREVVARYLAALGEEPDPGNSGLLGEFRLTRKVGQNLGALAAEVASRGWDAALAERGLSGEAGSTRPKAAAVLAGALMEADGGLEGAATRSSLSVVLQDLKVAEQIDPPQIVSRFLAEALYQRLVLDLGESLEAASQGYGHWRQGLDGLKSWIAEAGKLEEPPPQQWRGLAGWKWVTLALEKMADRLLKPAAHVAGG